MLFKIISYQKDANKENIDDQDRHMEPAIINQKKSFNDKFNASAINHTQTSMNQKQDEEKPQEEMDCSKIDESRMKREAIEKFLLEEKVTDLKKIPNREVYIKNDEGSQQLGPVTIADLYKISR